MVVLAVGIPEVVSFVLCHLRCLWNMLKVNRLVAGKINAYGVLDISEKM
jgi:hypothetical protein